MIACFELQDEKCYIMAMAVGDATLSEAEGEFLS